MSKNTEKQPLTPDRSTSESTRRQRMTDSCLRHITAIARLWGLGVIALLWAATVTTLRGDIRTPIYVGYYLLAASLLVTFFEITWILDKMACCVRQGCCCRCWSVILWVDGWRKFFLYTALSVPLFLQGLTGVIDVIGGFCLLVLACLYLVKSFARFRITGEEQKSGTELHQVSVTVRHEISTQTDVTSTSTEKKEAPPNPFDEEPEDVDGGEGSKADDAKDGEGSNVQNSKSDKKSAK